MTNVSNEPYGVLLELVRIAESERTKTTGNRHVEGAKKTIFRTFPKRFYRKDGRSKSMDPATLNSFQKLISQLRKRVMLGDKYEAPSGISVFNPPVTKDGTLVNPDLRYIQMRFGNEQRIIGCIYVVVKVHNAPLGNFSANIYWECCWHGAGRNKFDPGTLLLTV